eukprot:TRINITY_DN5317_c0_g1_i3.p1 TRINITY_DN5317_c0_g1~~TRINITY_DN5317_c0_g1_i3.p1  ORF type:complete len:165 (+),score=35.59 TRINITY_DN5317_c0_g1_i3:238-732(+)
MTSRLPPDRMDDRRRRNGESAKRSRQKRKVALQDVEGNYCKLITGQAALSEENAKLKELLTTLTAGPEEQSPEDGDARAKRVKASGPRVVLMAKSVESAAGAHSSTSHDHHCATHDLPSSGGLHPLDLSDDLEWLHQNDFTATLETGPNSLACSKHDDAMPLPE